MDDHRQPGKASELHEIHIHRVPYDSEESEAVTASASKASNHGNAGTWTLYWQRKHQSWKLWLLRFLMVSLSVSLFVFFPPALLALIPLSTIIYCRIAMLASKQRKHTWFSIAWYFVAGSAWAFCTVWWLGGCGPTYVAGGFFAFWLAIVLSLCVYAIAHWQELIEADRNVHLNEMLDLQSDWAWGLYVVGIVVDWFFFSVMALQKSLPLFLEQMQHQLPAEFWPLFSVLGTGKAITPGYGYTSILVFNVVLAMFPAVSLADSLADWLGFRWKSRGRLEDLVERYRSIITACFFTLLLSWDLRLIACREPEEEDSQFYYSQHHEGQTSVFFDQKDPCWQGQHLLHALLSCFFIVSFIPVVLPVTYRTDIVEGKANDILWCNPIFVLIERPLKMIGVGVGILGKAADWESYRQLALAIIPLLLAGMCHFLWSSNHPGLNKLKKYLYLSAFITAFLYFLEHFLEDNNIMKDAYPLMTACLILGHIMVLVGFFMFSGVNNLLWRTRSKRVARRCWRLCLSMIIFGCLLLFLFFPHVILDATTLLDRRDLPLNQTTFTNITIPGSCALMVTSACCLGCSNAWNTGFPWNRRNAPWLDPDDCSAMAGVILYSKGTAEFQKYLDTWDQQHLVGAATRY